MFRHPIKGVGVEEVTETAVSAGRTLPWDRAYAVAHEAARLSDGWSPCANFVRGAKSPALMAVTARVQGQHVALSHPDLAPIVIDPMRDGDLLLEWLRPICNPNRAAPARLVPAGKDGMTDSPFPSIAILNLASLRALSQRVGRALDPRRFRGNIWFDGGGPWEEFEWIGRRVAVGDVTFEVRERITRCTATHADPDSGRTDTDVLGTLEAGWGHQDFGVYAVALSSGNVATGDEVRPA
nr:MOSC domain-containing protein [Halovulum dunhuangense]